MLIRRALLTGLAAAALPHVALPQGLPNRNITIVVPYPPGGPIDTLARAIGQEAAADLKQAVVVENRPGASGLVATGAVARAEPDGTTLILGTNQTHATNQSLIKNWTFDAVKDFAPVAGIAAMPHVLVIRKDFAAKTLADVVAMAKAKPGVLTFGSMGNGSGAHLAAELFKTKAGIDMLHVPYTGANNANIIGDLLANRVQVYFPAYPATLAALPSGKIKLLGVFYDQHVKQRPDLPTVKEVVPGLVTVPSWFGFMGPAGLPQPIVARLEKEIRTALEDKEISDKLEQVGIVPVGSTAAEMGSLMRRYTDELSRLAKQAGIEPN